MDVAVIIEQCLPLYYTILICGAIFCFLLCYEGKVVRGIVIFSALFYFSILITDLRTDIQFVRENFDFNGIVFPQIEVVEITMPVFEPTGVNWNTGVITGGYDSDSLDPKKDNGNVLDDGSEGVVLPREV